MSPAPRHPPKKPFSRSSTEARYVEETRFFDIFHKHEDINEILNYRKAMMLSQKHLKDGRPIALNLLLQLHAILLDSVRGQHKAPGQFRKHQN